MGCHFGSSNFCSLSCSRAGDRFGSFCCGCRVQDTGCVANGKQFRWSVPVGNSWTSPQDGSKSFVLDPRRRSGQQLQRKFKGHRVDEFRSVSLDLRSCLEGSQSAHDFLCVKSAGPQRKLQPMRSGSSRGCRWRSQLCASVFPIQERVDSCKLFLERAKKRVQRAQEVIDRSCEQKVLHEAEVVEGEEKLAKARQRTSQSPPVVVPQVSELLARIDAIVVDRDSRNTGYVDGLWSSRVRRHPTNSWSLGERCFSALHGGKRPQRRFAKQTFPMMRSFTRSTRRKSPRQGVRRAISVPEEVLDDLEAVDSSGSDDDRLVRPWSGRKVMPWRSVAEGSQGDHHRRLRVVPHTLHEVWTTVVLQ